MNEEVRSTCSSRGRSRRAPCASVGAGGPYPGLRQMGDTPLGVAPRRPIGRVASKQRLTVGRAPGAVIPGQVTSEVRPHHLQCRHVAASPLSEIAGPVASGPPNQRSPSTASLAGALLAFTVTAPAAPARPVLPPQPPGWTTHPPLPYRHWDEPVHIPVRIVVIGGMPGWQIALIAVAAALAAAALAVLADRAWAGRRKAITAAARRASSAICAIASASSFKSWWQSNLPGQVFCLREGPEEEAIRQHHAALGVPRADIHPGDPLPRGWPTARE